jgi:hypothetical protein
VGIEIEYISPNDDYDQWSDMGLCKTDGSVNDSDGYGLEFVLHPAQGDELFTRIELVTKWLRDKDCWVNGTCGLHVHLDMGSNSRQEKRNVFRAFTALQSVILGMVPRSRSDNEFCRPVRQNFNMANASSNRYRTLNVTSLRKHGTFEFRMHSGTLASKKIKDWVTFLLSFVDTFQNVRLVRREWEKVCELTDREKLIYIFQQVKCPMSLKKVLVRRLRRYKHVKLLKTAVSIDKCVA